jgi:peptidoglycan/LPS O-acetylase OafA/YrhL
MQRLSPWLISLCLLLFAFAAIRNYHPSLGSPGSFERSLFNRYPWMDEFSFALSYGCGILAVLFNRSGGLLRSIFEWTPLRWLGLITYSLYIWHIPIIGSLRVNVGPAIAHLNHVLAFGLFWVLVLVIIIPFAFVSYTLIEKPGLHLSARLRQQLLARRIAPQGTSSSPGNLQPQEELSAKQKDPIILS